MNFHYILFYLLKSIKNSSSNEVGNIELEKDKLSKLSYGNPIKFGVPIIFVSIIITLLGAKLTVSSALILSYILNIADSFLGLSIIAIGTSLPEIATSIRAAKRKKSDIIIGNIVGSNIYNLLLILGTSSLFENFGYNKNLELQYRGRLRELKNFVPVKDGESDLLMAMKQVAETQKGPEDQIPSAGCGIKWKYD